MGLLNMCPKYWFPMCVLDAVFRRTLRATALCSNTLYTAIPETVSELGHLRVELVMRFFARFLVALLQSFARRTSLRFGMCCYKERKPTIGLFWLSKTIWKSDVVQGVHRTTSTHWNVAQDFRSVWVEIIGTSLR